MGGHISPATNLASAAALLERQAAQCYDALTGPQKYLLGKYLVSSGTKATGPTDGLSKPAPLLYVYPREDGGGHGGAHQHKLGETTLFIIGKPGGNEISYPMQEPIKISHSITISCLYMPQAYYMKSSSLKDGIGALLKQAPWVTYKTILQYLVQGVIITQNQETFKICLQ